MPTRFWRCVRWAAAGAALSIAGSASGTWSILLVDTATGEIAIGSATCLTRFDLQENTPVLIPGVGAATAQSFVDRDGFNRTFIRDALASGQTPADVLAGLEVFDGGHQTRQYGIVDTVGGVATFTGTQAGAWAGGATGVLKGAGVSGGDIAYAVQGNVLTGEPVVLGAVEAMRREPGDLPAKLLAGMVAARTLGGDGRCSCATNAPTACGDTPDNFEKSADIGYMLVARDGDTEGCSPTYRSDEPLGDIEPVDLASGPAFAIARPSAPSIEIRAVRAIAAPAALGDVRVVPIPAPAGDIETGDLDRDGLADLVVCAADGSAVWTLLQDPASPTGFAGAAEALVGLSGQSAIVADLDGDTRPEVVVASRSSGAVTVLNNTPNGLALGDVLDVPGAEAVSSADLDGDAMVDLAVISSTLDRLDVFSQQSGLSFTRSGTGPTTIPSPTLVLASDPDRDGQNEVIVAGATRDYLEVFEGDASPVLGGQVFLPSRPRDLDIADIDGDGTSETFVLGVAGSVVLRPFFAGGPLIYDRRIPIFLQPVSAAVTDLDRDGDPDLAVTGLASNSIRLVENLGGVFPLTTGCGDGRFFLELNVADSRREDPDPVDQLVMQFETWSLGLVGVPDAVRSTARPRRPIASSQPGCVTTVDVVLRDREGRAAEADALEVVALGSTAGTLQVAAVRRAAPDRFEVDLAGTGTRGPTDFQFRVTADDRGVVLMPRVSLRADDPADLDLDGDADADDFSVWLSAYTSGRPAADQNMNGIVDPGDYTAWVVNRNGRCDP